MSCFSIGGDGAVKWYDKQDEYEKSAIIVFRIGMPFVIAIFWVVLVVMGL